jgi:hypothetical protein
MNEAERKQDLVSWKEMSDSYKGNCFFYAASWKSWLEFYYSVLLSSGTHTNTLRYEQNWLTARASRTVAFILYNLSLYPI